MTYDVYLLESPSGGRYVGLTKAGVKARWRSHTHAARHGSPYALHRAIRKYGAKAFSLTVIERLTTAAGAARAEQLWIRELDTQACGYNETAGGDGVAEPSFEARARMGNRTPRTAETRARISTALRGRTRGPQTAEHRAKIAAAHKGKTLSDVTRAKVRAANVGKVQSADTRAKRAAALRGHAVSEETRAKISAANRGAKRTPEQCARITAGRRAAKNVV